MTSAQSPEETIWLLEITQEALIDTFRQKETLEKSPLHVMSFFSNRSSSKHLERIARIHGKGGVDIHPDLFDTWPE